MKFKIFLSSNRQEFHNERRLIKEAIENDIILNRFFKIFSFEEELHQERHHKTDTAKQYSNQTSISAS